MPLARIITRTPQDAVSAADYLRSEGYTVEAISPGDFRVTPAELELNLDKVPACEAVERAQQLLAAQRAGTPTAAATPTPSPPRGKVAIAYDIAGRPVEFEDEGEAILERRKARNTLGRALVAMLRRSKDWADARFERVWSAAVAMSRRRGKNRALRRQSESAGEQEELRQTEQLARERVRRDAEQHQERIAAERWAEEQARVAAVHEAMIAAQRQSEPPAEASSLSVPAEEPMIAPGPEPAASVVASAAEVAPPAVPSQRDRPSRPFVVHRRRTSRRVQKAIAAVCGIGFLLLMGFVAHANRRPAAPLPPSALIISGWTKQEVPFGTSVITPPAPVRRAPAAVSKPAAPAVPKPSPAATKPPSKPAPGRPVTKPSRLSAQGNSAADDEVVVRRVRPSPARRAAATTASSEKLKRYSDVE